MASGTKELNFFLHLIQTDLNLNLSSHISLVLYETGHEQNKEQGAKEAWV